MFLENLSTLEQVLCAVVLFLSMGIGRFAYRARGFKAEIEERSAKALPKPPGPFGHTFDPIEEIQRAVEKVAPSPGGYMWKLTTETLKAEIPTAGASHPVDSTVARLTFVQMLPEKDLVSYVVNLSHYTPSRTYRSSYASAQSLEKFRATTYERLVTSTAEWARKTVDKYEDLSTSNETPIYKLF